jgi:hypothetical protein
VWIHSRHNSVLWFLGEFLFLSSKSSIHYNSPACYCSFTPASARGLLHLPETPVVTLIHEAGSFSRSCQLLSCWRILWSPKVYYSVHSSRSLVSILSQITPVRNTQTYFPKTSFNIISHLRLGFPSGPFPAGFTSKTLQACMMHVLPNLICRRVHVMKLLTVQLPQTFYYLSFLGPNILLRTQFSNNLSLYSSFNVENQVSRPYRTRGKTIISYILIFKLYTDIVAYKGVFIYLKKTTIRRKVI